MEPVDFEKVTLPNGLDVIFHQDTTLPLVAVNVWYHVGSKDDEPGKTGFAHLFEHIMFEGTKHHNESHFKPLQLAGASLNGSTNLDRTNYWENIPSNYLELALWLEADRMGFLLEALDQQRFDIQRDVVKNERRQSYENRPYGIAELRLQEAAYPLPHPYHWPTIGFHEDLDAANLDDVHAFYRRFYSPSNASLAIAGDFAVGEAKELVERYFGDLVPGPALPRTARSDSPLHGHVDIALYDRVLLQRCYLVWPGVPRFHPDEAPLAVLARILGDGKSSRLFRTLVYERRMAQSASAQHDGAEIAGDFGLELTAAPDITIGEIEKVAHQELEKMRHQAPAPEELKRAQNRIEWQHVRQLGSIGGFGGKANALNYFNVYGGNPNLLNQHLERYLAVRPEDVRRVAAEYLGDRYVRLTVLPEPSRSYGSPIVDRMIKPTPSPLRTFVPTVPTRGRLANGLNVLVAEKQGMPTVAFGLVLRAGAAKDSVKLPGLSSFTTGMLQEGTTTLSSKQVTDGFEFIGSQLAAVTGRESTFLGTSTLSRQWPKALELIADLVQNPTFPEKELDRIREERLTALRRLRDDPTALANRLAPTLLYGRESTYGHPLSGTEVALRELTKNDLVTHFQKHYGPEDATLVVAGHVSMENVMKLAEEHLGGWRNDKHTPIKIPAPLDGQRGPDTTTLYILDKPGATQSVIRAGYISVPIGHPDHYALILLNHLFGGQFTARLNVNLRQDKGYSYGYHSSIEWHTTSSLLLAGGGVQTTVTREAVEETLKEFHNIRGDKPVDVTEFEAAKSSLLRQFPASFETPMQILEYLVEIVSFGLGDDYYLSFTPNIEAVSLNDVRKAAQRHVGNDRLALLVVGDRALVEPELLKLGLPLRRLDYEGGVVPS